MLAIGCCCMFKSMEPGSVLCSSTKNLAWIRSVLENDGDQYESIV